MARDDDFNAHFGGALHDAIKIVYLEPEQHAVSIRLIVAIGDAPVMVFHFKTVQLKHKLTL